MITLYNVVSADGFISKIDHSEDFIPDEMWEEFLKLCREYGAVIVGRKTYDVIQKYEAPLIESFEVLPIKKVVVSRDANFHPKSGYVVAHSPKEAYEIAAEAALKTGAEGKKEVLLSSGPTLNTSVIKEGLVHRIILEKLPVRLEEGFTVFDEEEIKPELKLVSKEDKGEGRERCVYEIGKIGQVEA